jgi:microcystin-dependent protein
MGTPYLSQIDMFSFGFPPKGWAMCNGQLLPINQNQALFSLLGTTYGGDGRVNFALPDLRSRIAIGFGQGPGLAPYSLGERSGAETRTLSLNEMPAHTHPVDITNLIANARCKNGLADQHSPVGNVPGVGTTASTTVYSSADPDANMSASSLVVGGTAAANSSGGGQPHSNVQPYLTINFCIALQGIFPSQS